MAVTKSGTGTWDLGREDSGTSGRGTRGRGDVGTWGRGTWGSGDVGKRGRGTRERRGRRDLGRLSKSPFATYVARARPRDFVAREIRSTCGKSRTWNAGLGDAGLENVGTRGRGAYGTRRRDKQTTPDFFAEFVNYNFRCSRERY